MTDKTSDGAKLAPVMPSLASGSEDWAKKIERALDAREGQKKLRAGKPVIFTWQRELRWTQNHS